MVVLLQVKDIQIEGQEKVAVAVVPLKEMIGELLVLCLLLILVLMARLNLRIQQAFSPADGKFVVCGDLLFAVCCLLFAVCCLRFSAGHG